MFLNKLFPLLLRLFLGAHFTVLFFYLMPSNPISKTLRKPLKSYINPVFSQSWHLFAPRPLNTNLTLSFRYTSFSSKVADTTNWVDVTSPLIAEKHSGILKNPQRFLKLISVTVKNNLVQSNKLHYYAKINDVYYLNNEKKILSTDNLLRYASYCHMHRFAQKVDSLKVQYKIEIYKFPRFSHRDDNLNDSLNGKSKIFLSHFLAIQP